MVFTVAGKPQGKARPKAHRQGDSIRFYEPSKTKNYEYKIGWAYRFAGGKMLEKPVGIYVTAAFAIPKSFTKAQREMAQRGELLPQVKPDAGNILKAVLDGLNGVAYPDDKNVYAVSCKKYYTTKDEQEGLTIYVYEGLT